MKRIILTAPNFSEGRDQEKIQKILDCFRNREHVQILRWQGDPDHNRFGANVIGEPEAIYEAMLEAIGTALELIDMTKSPQTLLPERIWLKYARANSKAWPKN